MKKIIAAILALFCLSLFLPAAFAADDARFKPTIRVGVAVDTGETHYTFDIQTPNGFGGIGGIQDLDVVRPSEPRFYLATELPFAVTDRLTVALGADWAFSGAKKDIDILYTPAGSIDWERDGRSDWVKADFLVSYALIKNRSVVKDLSVVAGLRWDYQTMALDNPHNVVAINSGPGNTVDFRMQRLAPVFGVDCTFTGIKHGIFGGDLKLGFLAGPVVWGTVDFRESFSTPSFYRIKDDLSHGYVVNAFGEMTLLSGPIAPCADASLSLFIDYTKSTANGTVRGGAKPLGS